MGKPAIVSRREQVLVRSPIVRPSLCDTCGYAVGSCGCGGGSRSFASSGVPLPPARGDGSYVANPPGGGWDRPCSDGCFPKGYTETRWQRLMRELGISDKRAPYVNQMADYQEMDTLLSPITTLPIPTGTTTNVTIQPEGGQFIVAYWRIIVRTAADGLQSVDWTYRKPRVAGCPVPCDNLDRDTMAQFAMSVPEACPCGIPLLAFIQRQGEVLPMTVPVTNNSAAELTAQVEVRGYCCDSRICL